MTRISLSEKLIIYFMLLSMMAIGIVGIYSYYSAKQAQMARTYDQLASVKYLKKKQIEYFYVQQVQMVQSLANNAGWAGIMKQDPELSVKPPQILLDALSSLELINKHERILVLSKATSYSISFNSEHQPQVETIINPFGDSLSKLVKAENPYITDLIWNENQQGWFQYVLTSVKTKDEQTLVFLGLEISSATIDSLMPDQNPLNGLGNSGEAYLAGKDRFLRSNSRFFPNSILKQKINEATAALAISGQEGTWLLKDYRGVQVLGAFAVLESPAPPWILIAEIDFREAMVPIYAIRNNVLFFSVFISAFVLLITWLISRRITRPIIQLQKAALELGDGKLGTRVDIDSRDEIGELAEIFNQMSTQLQENEVQISKERARRMKAAFDGQDIERQRLSRELHDGLGQSLIAQKLRLESLSTGNKADIENGLADLKKCADQLVDEVRRISNALMPAQLYQFGLAAALRQHCEEVSKYGKIEVKFDATGDFEPLSRKIKTYLFRIVQEALNNVVKHSNAKSAAVEIALTRENLFLSISDDGQGFDSSKVCSGNGLNNMKERIELLHGVIVFNTDEGRGATIEIQIPVKR